MVFSEHWHIFFDLLAFATASFFFRRETRQGRNLSTLHERKGYWASLTIGALIGAYAAGSLNLSLFGILRIGHSIAGALAGGIIAVELYKLKNHEHVSTGAIFVAPLMAGLAVGRLGCFFSGLADETYGRPTNGPFGIDFGDGTPRFPVQLFESSAMLVGLVVFQFLRRGREEHYKRAGFYLFVLWYSGQRFVWEFLKPYPVLVGRLNLFHLICLAMMVYAVTMLRTTHALRTRS